MEYTTLCYIIKDNKWLMLLKGKRKNDFNKDKWVGVGGHLEKGEAPLECLKRECLEETGLTILNPILRGTILFSDNDFQQVMYLYTVTEFTGTLIECDEGELAWVKENEIFKLNLWPGDIPFLKRLINKENNINLKLIYNNKVFVRSEELDLSEIH